MNRLPNRLGVEDMEEKLVRPSHAGFLAYKAEPLVVQKLVGLWSENGTAKQAGCLLRHGNKQVALVEHIVARNFARVVFLLFTSVAVAAALVEVAGRQEHILTFIGEELPFKGIAVFDVAEF